MRKGRPAMKDELKKEQLNEKELDEVSGGANSNDFSRCGAIYNQRNENLDASKRDLDREKDTLMDDLDRAKQGGLG